MILARPSRTVKLKTDPLPHFAAHPDRPTHRLDQLPADGKAEAGAPEPAGGGGVGLDEGFEQSRQLLVLQAQAGVDDFEAEQCPLAVP